jgi:DedD protein
MKYFVKSMGVAAGCLAVSALLGGCFRQHIVSSPPAQRPAQSTEVAPAPAPAPVKDEAAPAVTESRDGVYVVDAPKPEEPAVVVQEGSLSDEAPVPGDTAASQPVRPDALEPSDGPAATVVPAGAAVAEGGKYFVQVGAFSDLENANKALARLLSDGYKGSKLDTTGEGLFRVQAGAFADRAAAEEALLRLQGQYPRGFVLKTD